MGRTPDRANLRPAVVFAIASLPSTLLARFVTPSQGAERYEVIVDKNVEAEMRDRVILRADVYRPAEAGRYPALLQRTPYSKDGSGTDSFRRISTRGYVVVVQDTRGRYMSDGVARPHDEGEDGYDTVEWAAGLPYVNGKVGMFGGSYSATTQLLTAPLRPPHLVALFPSASYASRYDMVFQGGAFYLADGLSWNLGQAADVRRRDLAPHVERDHPIGLNDHQSRLLREHWLWHVPLKTMCALDLPRYAPGYFEMLSHPTYDAFWEKFDVGARHDQFDTPAFHLTGWYDTLLNGTLRNFTGLRSRARTEQARTYQRLIVGPWTHARPGPDTTKVGDVDFGPGAGLDSEDLMIRWFDYWLKEKETLPGEQGSVVDGPPVRIFVMGENQWRDEQEWPLARARPTAYYLTSKGCANTLRGDGVLKTEPPANDPPDRYIYDPWDPVPTGPLGGYSRLPADQRAVEEREDVLVYTTEPMGSPVEVTGPISLVLWVSTSAPDTDFTGKLVDVFPDGTARALTDGILRARYRTGKSNPTLLVPDRPVELTVDLGATSNVFLKGHRIRLEISSSNFPRFDRNPNTGGSFGEDATLLRVEQTILHDQRHPSRLIVPVIP